VTRKIDLAKLQQADSHLFGAWVNNTRQDENGALKARPADGNICLLQTPPEARKHVFKVFRF